MILMGPLLIAMTTRCTIEALDTSVPYWGDEQIVLCVYRGHHKYTMNTWPFIIECKL